MLDRCFGSGRRFPSRRGRLTSSLEHFLAGSVVDLVHTSGHAIENRFVVTRADDCAVLFLERLDERLSCRTVEVVGWLIE